MTTKDKIETYKTKCIVFEGLCQRLREKMAEFPKYLETAFSNPTEPAFYENTRPFREIAWQVDEFMDAFKRLETKWSEIPKQDRSGLTSPGELVQNIVTKGC